MSTVRIGDRYVGAGHKTFIVAELSANHGQRIETALRLVRAAADAGADAVKLQTYRPETMTLKSDLPHFGIAAGTVWEGRRLYDLYSEAQTPWDWHLSIKEETEAAGMIFFSTPFDASSVDFLEDLSVEAYKIASFEIVDIPLIRRVARTGKPVILSTGMASLSEVAEAVEAVRSAGATETILLKCTSAYPAPLDDMNLATIPHLASTFGCPAGLSDHTLGTTAPIVAVSLGASIIEKHLTLARSDGGPDSSFSLEPAEFREMTEGIRAAEKLIGKVHYGVNATEQASRAFRRTLYVVADINAGEAFTPHNVRAIRPAGGLHTRFFSYVLSGRAAHHIKAGTPLQLEHVVGGTSTSL